MALKDATIRTTKLSGQQKQKKLSDSAGLYLRVLKSGKYWRLDYRMHGERKTLAIGVYPDMRLASYTDKAGQCHLGARELLHGHHHRFYTATLSNWVYNHTEPDK